jgi:tyrosinase
MMAATRYVSPPISVKNLDHNLTRADIEFYGVDHAGATFRAAVFVNNPAADETTPKTLENGYAGCFHIFGHGGCLGDPGHCEVRGEPRPFDPRPAHPLTPAKKTVIATKAIQQAISAGNEITVTVVPTVTSGTPKTDLYNVLKFDRLTIVTYC